MPNIVNGSVVQFRSGLSLNVSVEYDSDPTKTALVLWMLGFNPEYFENWKSKSRVFKLFSSHLERAPYHQHIEVNK